jgi:hypothetical protein
MQAALEPFRIAHVQENPFGVAELLSPTAPRTAPDRLYKFHNASNAQQVEDDVRSALRFSRNKLSPKEHNAWTDIFVSYWKAVHEILRAEANSEQGTLGDRQLVDVYEAWKELTNHILRHMQNGSLPSWTVVCMYVTANNLRIMAIKADEQLASIKGSVTFNAGYGDDIASTVARNEKLEEAARIFNRMFALCLGDRFETPVPTVPFRANSMIAILT